MNLGDKFADLEDCLGRIFADLREVDYESLSEEDEELVSEAYKLAGLYEDALAGNISWEDARRTMRKILYD